MDTKKMKQLAMFFLAASLLVTLSACGSRNPAAMEQTVWEDPVPSIRGNIENGVYTNQWLNLKKNTSTDPAFLEEYNRVSCLADPQRSRWCELYEYDKDGNSVILTTEKLPQDTTLSQAAEAYVKSFRNKFEDTAEGVKISTQAGSPDTNYIFHSYTCTLYRIQITSSCEGTVVERKNADLLFWEKDGYLVELQITDNDTVSANDLFPDGSSSNDTPSDSVPPDDAPSVDASSSNDPATVPATAPMNEVPYTTSLSASIAIYSKPDSTSSFVQNVGQDGIYTIVEEAYDAEGNLWGKLKSGLGWVDLSSTKDGQLSGSPISANFAPDSVLNSDHHEAILDHSEYVVKVAFWAHENLSNVQFSSLQFEGNSYQVAEVLYTLPELTPDKPLVTGISFPGPASIFGISFTDSSGATRCYAVFTSGRNGELVLEEYS